MGSESSGLICCGGHLGLQECILEYLGIEHSCDGEPPICSAAVADTSYQFFRFFVTQNWGAASMCLYEVKFYGPNNCLYDMRAQAQRLKSNQTVNC
eukprot:SAG31_NODE_11176_length_1058_cov_0.984359_3_plen_95_part_01